MTRTTSKKKHADFQSSYRRSFNFSKTVKNEKFELNEEGELVLKRPTEGNRP